MTLSKAARRAYWRRIQASKQAVNGLPYLDWSVKGETMLRQIDEGLDRLKQHWIGFFIRFNGYRFAGAILLMMWLGTLANPTNGIFRAIELVFPPLVPWVWEVLFVVCGFRMWTLKSGGKWEALIVFFAFLIPVIVFYAFLLGIALRSPNSMPFTDILIFLAILTPISFVTRTMAFNYYRELTPKLIAENVRLKEENERLNKGEGLPRD